MAISNIQLNNTFNDFRTAFNTAANTITALTDGGSGSIITNAVTANTITANNLTTGRVALVGTSGLVQDDAGLTYSTITDVLTVGGGIVTANVTANNLTSGRVAIVGTSGIIQDDSGMTYNSTTDVLTLSGGTDASNSTSGTLVVSGGVGIGKNLYVSGNTFISGNLTILGGNTELSTTQINVNDPLIQLANNNTSDLVDIGVFGQYNAGSGNVHSGIFRDSTDGVWKLFRAYSAEPTTKIFPASNNFAYADFAVNALTANSYVYLNNQNVLRLGSSANANYVGLRSSAAVGANVTWTLPATDGSVNQGLVTNGSGVLSFATVLTPPSGVANSIQYNSGSSTFSGSANLIYDGANVTIGSTGSLRLASSNANYVAVRSGSAVGANVTWTLPTADGTSGQALVTNGTGTLSFAAAGATVSNTSSSSTFYPTMSSATTGSLTTAYVTGNALYYVPSTGTLSATNFNSLSDMALKDNITTLENPMSILEQLTGVQFTWKDNGLKSSGVIAQDIEKVLPHLVSAGENHKTVNYLGIIPYLIETIKELNERISSLESKPKRSKKN